MDASKEGAEALMKKIRQIWCWYKTGHTGVLQPNGQYFICDHCGYKAKL